MSPAADAALSADPPPTEPTRRDGSPPPPPHPPPPAPWGPTSGRVAFVTGSPARTGPTWPSCCSPGLRGARHQAPRVDVQHRADRSPLPGPARGDTRDVPALRGPDRRHQPARLVRDVQPDEVYHLAAQSHVGQLRHARVHRRTPTASARCGCSRRFARLERGHRFYQASTSELYGYVAAATDGRPHRSTRAPLRRRQALRLLDHGQLPRGLRHVACNGILFNHESPAPRRDVRDPQDHPRGGARSPRPAGQLYLGNLDACATGATRATTSRACG